MTEDQIKLVAAYLNGENVAEVLLEACKADDKLLKQVAQLAAVERLIAHHCNDDGADIFIAEIRRRIEQTQDANFVINTMSKLKQDEKGGYKFILIIFVVCLCIMLFIGLFSISNEPNISSKQVAKISRVVGAVNADIKIDTNQVVTQGIFEITDGYAEVELQNGVTLLLEGPSKLDVKSDNHVVLHQGSLVANVPSTTRNFILGTPNTEINQGSEFGVHVDDRGISQIHALKGNVKTRLLHQKQFEYIQEHQARSFDVNHQIEIIENNPEQFMRSLPGKLSSTPEYLHWSFDNDIQGIYPCTGKGIDGKCYDAFSKSLTDKKPNDLVANGQFGEGVYINGIDSWLETEFPGIGGNNPRTVSFWVKVPKDFSSTNGYGILSWGLSSVQSAWQISPNPTLKDGPLGRIRIGTNKAQIIGTTDIRDERWHHVAIVLFGGNNANLSTHVLMYIDGELEQSSNKSIAKVFTRLSHPKSRPLMMGRNIGFSNPKSTHKFKFFKGWLDEVFIFNAALEQKQIQHLMKFNRLDLKNNE